MGDPKASVILDISSDEEPGCGGVGGVVDDIISELFKDEDDVSFESGECFEDEDTDDSDDLVVVGEVFAKRKRRIYNSSETFVNGPSKIVEDNSDDDDCVVLDGDPDKLAVVEKERTGTEYDSGDDSDDLVVVSEKGQVACRDYPHPRHLCAKFPFHSMQHELHCDQCHCFVCDSLAPCVHWGTGVSSIDHCHATDKDEFWKAQRHTMRCDKAPLPAPMVHETSRLMGPPMENQAPPLPPNLLLQNQGSRQVALRPCTMPTSNGMLNVNRLGRSHHPGYVASKSRFQPQLISQHLSNANIHVSHRDRRHSSGNTIPQYMSPRVMFKRTGAVRVALASNRSGYNSSRHSYSSRLSPNPPSTVRLQGYSHGGVPVVSDPYQDAYQQEGQSANAMTSQSGPTVGSRFSSSGPPQILTQQNMSGGYVPVSPQILPQQNMSGHYVPLHPQMASLQHNSGGYTHYVPPMSSQLQVNGAFRNSVPPQSQVPLQTIENGNGNSYIFENTMPTLSEQNADRAFEYSESCQPQSFGQFEADNAFQCPAPSEFVTSSPPNMGRTPENLPFPHEPQEYSLIRYSSQTILQQGNQTQEASGPSVAVPASGCVPYTNPSSQQLSMNNPQLQSAEPTGNISANMGFQYHGSPDFAPSDLQFDNWLFEDISKHGVPAHTQFDTSSPEPPPYVDGGLFPDF